jgi:tetratricopeptide (TPR) repeat protein
MKAKTWVSYIIAVIILPCVLLLCIEIALRLFGIGYDPHFFCRVKNKGKVFCVDNPAFGRRFFPPTLVRQSIKLRFPLQKDKNEKRIFVLGSSAAQGDPATAFAFSRDLNLMLRGRYGSTRCEVINAAVSATNSHIVVPIADECSHLSPDIFIVYMGNNEVIGPFGPGTVFSHLSSLWFIRLRIFLSSTRIGQLASAISESITKSDKTPAGWGGMRMFLKHKIRFNDPRLTRVYQNYRNNLTEICKTARRSGARIVLCTIASNLKDCEPFFSMHRPDISPDDLKQWNGYYQQAMDSLRQGWFEDALALFTKAEAIDSTHAELHYRMAQCLTGLGQFDQAKQNFATARDYDALRFRADSHLNQIIKEVGREFADCAVVLDIENLMSTASDHGICGDELFLEHVHYNFNGNYLLAASMLKTLDSMFAVPVVDTNTLSEDVCRDHLAYNSWQELEIDRAIYKRLINPPFSDQEDNIHKVQAFGEKMNRLSRLVTDSGQSILESYHNAVALESQDWQIYNLLGRYLIQNKLNAVEAEQAYRKVFDFLPHDQFVRFNLALALERQGRISEAIEYYRQAIRIDPLLFDAYVNLTDDLMMESRTSEAKRYLKQILRINPALPAAQERYALMLLGHGTLKSNIPDFDKSIISPMALASIYNKSGLRLLNQGHTQDAIKHFECAVGIYPELAIAQSNLGRALVITGKSSEGIGHLKKAISIDSTRPDLHVNFADALAAQRQPGNAVKEYRTALRLNPKMFMALNSLGMLLARQDSFPQAIDLFVRAIKVQPSMLAAQKNLITACASINQTNLAIDLLTQLSGQYPQAAEIHYSLGKLLLEQGKTTEAQKQLRVAAQQNPDLPEIENLLSASSDVKDIRR